MSVLAYSTDRNWLPFLPNTNEEVHSSRARGDNLNSFHKALASTKAQLHFWYCHKMTTSDVLSHLALTRSQVHSGLVIQ